MYYMELSLAGTRKITEIAIFAGKSELSRNISEYKEKINLFEKGQITSTSPTLDKAIMGDLVPHPTTTPWDLYGLIYERQSMVYNGFNNTADFAIQSGYDIEASDNSKTKILEWMDKVNFELILSNIFKHLQIYGNAYLDISDISFPKLLPPKTMYVRVVKGGNDDGKILGYTQVLNNTSLALDTKNSIQLDKDDVVHFKYNDTINPFYGMSELKPVIGALTRYANWTEDLGEILHRFAAPYLHHALGTDEAPATQAQIDTYIGRLNTRFAGEDWVTSGAVEITPIVATQGMIQMDGLVRTLQDEIIAGLRIPEIFVRGGVNANKNVGQIELQAFDRKVRALQLTVSNIVEDKLFKKLAAGKAKLKWNEFSVEGEKVRAERLKIMTESGIPIATAMDMIGWGTWVDEMKKEREQEDKRNTDIKKQETDIDTKNQKDVISAKPASKANSSKQ